MICDYNTFLSADNILTFEEANEIHLMMKNEIDSDSDALELYDELVKKSIEYTMIRANWTLMNSEEKLEADKGRTLKHDSLIIKFNQLARFLKMQGYKVSWRDKLGYIEDDASLRKRIGDMGCYLAFIHSVNGR